MWVPLADAAGALSGLSSPRAHPPAAAHPPHPLALPPLPTPSSVSDAPELAGGRGFGAEAHRQFEVEAARATNPRHGP